MENEWEKISIREEEEEVRNEGLRKGQWTPEEDSKLSSYVAIHGHRNWNFLARLAGLKRSGKSCRLRWLNYLRPDLRRGGFTLEEQLLILQLHFRWGNRWSKIAQELPGRTDNEVKNYWRTKVQRLAKQFNCDANSLQFREALCHIWIPRLVEQIRAGKNSQSESAPLINSPIYEGRNGAEEQCNQPNVSNLGFLLGPSCIDTFMDQPTVKGFEPNMLQDSYEAHISPDSGSSGSCVDYGQTWDQQSDDFLWELQYLNLNDDDSTLYLLQPSASIYP